MAYKELASVFHTLALQTMRNIWNLFLHFIAFMIFRINKKCIRSKKPHSTCKDIRYFFRHILLFLRTDYHCMASVFDHMSIQDIPFGNGTVWKKRKFKKKCSKRWASWTLNPVFVSSHCPNIQGSSSQIVNPQNRPVKWPLHWHNCFFPDWMHFPPSWQGFGWQDSTQSSLVEMSFNL